MELPNLDDLIRRYEAGETVAQLSRELGVCVHTVKAAFVARDVKIRSRAEAQRLTAKPPPDMNLCTQLYATGLSVKEIAGRLGVGYMWLWKRFKATGVPLRPTSETTRLLWGRPEYRRANTLERVPIRRRWWESLDPQRRKEIVGARIATALRGRTLSDEHRAKLSAARQGKKLTEAHKAKLAETAQRNLFKAESYEVAFAQALALSGHVATPQTAVGPYNLDLAFESLGIAVELDRGARHFSARRRQRTAERVKYLLDRDWSVLFVILGRNTTPADVLHQVLAFFDLAGRDKPFRRQYGMIWGNAHYRTRPDADLDGLPRVPGF